MATAPVTRTAQADAAQALYERYYKNVYRYALSQLRSPQDAEDAAQNTFLRAFAALQKGVTPENEAAWLFKIAHNVCASSKLAWLRRRRVEAPRDLDLLPVQPATPESRRDELAGLEDALAAMPPRLREAFLLREWQGLSYAEIAERLDTSRSAVETLIFRARKHLAQQLEQPAVRRVREALGLGPLLNLARGLFASAPTAVKAVGAVAVLAGAGVAVQPLVTPKRSTPPAATYELPIAPALAQSSPQATAPATAHRPLRTANAATQAPAASTTSVSAPAVSPPAPPAAVTAQPQPAPPAEAPATPSAKSAPAPVTTTQSGTSASVTVTTPALPVQAPPLPSVTVTTPALPVPPPQGLPPTPPLESPAVPAPSLPTVPTVTVPTSLP